MWKYIIDGLVIYLLYKVIFEIIVPVSKGVKTVRRNMEQVQRQQAEAFKRAQESTGQSGTASNQRSTAANDPKKEPAIDAEYIDFEEVKK
jgi:Sec-independent protein translocase protein TatA